MQDSLHTLLQQWEAKPTSDPNFRAAVWRRIAARKQRLSYRTWSRTEQFVGQPFGAAIVVAAVLFAGALSGNLWQKREMRLERVAGLNAYIIAVNPVAHAASHAR